MDSEVLKLIEREENESPRAYAAFLYFLGLPPSERSTASGIPKVVAHLGVEKASVHRWYNDNQWDQRVSVYDAYVFLESHKQRSRLAEEDNIRFVAEHRKAKERIISIGDKMIGVAENLLATAEIAGKVVETEMVTTADGRKVPLKTVIHMKSKVSDIPRLVEVGVKVQRLAAELPTEIIADMDILTADLSKLSDQELDAMMDRNNREIIQLGAQTKISDSEPIG